MTGAAIRVAGRCWAVSRRLRLAPNQNICFAGPEIVIETITSGSALRRVKQPRCWQFCPNFSVVRAWTNRATSETDSTSTLLTLSAITHFMTQRNAVIMNAQRNDQTVLPNRKKNGFSADASTGLEFISVPVGSFAGTLERILRIRDGQHVPADTGDQGGGQN